jgi:hypothetical protein
MKSRGSLRIIETLVFPPNFHKLLGQFHCMWLMFDVQVDWSIGKFLNLPTEQTHILVAGMEFGKKLRLLVELLKRSDHPKKATLIESIGTLQKAKRDIITHSYIASDETHIRFIYRARGEYSAGKLDFHIDQFNEHVATMIQAAQKYQRALGASGDEQIAFAEACLNIKQSRSTSPVSPSAKKRSFCAHQVRKASRNGAMSISGAPAPSNRGFATVAYLGCSLKCILPPASGRGSRPSSPLAMIPFRRNSH